MNQPLDNQAENIKKSIEDILGVGTTLKRRKKTKEDIDREKFEKIIRTLEEVETRSILLEEDFKLGFNKYDDKFHYVIDTLIELYLGEEALELVEFYLYGRANPDGSANSIMDDKNNNVPFENPTDLWNLIYLLKAELAKRSKKN